MALTDDELNDFDRSQIADWDPKDAQRARNDHPDLYRNHLTIAKMIDAWIVNLLAEDNDYYRGIVRAQQDIAAWLRKGELLPGGAMYASFVG